MQVVIRKKVCLPAFCTTLGRSTLWAREETSRTIITQAITPTINVEKFNEILNQMTYNETELTNRLHQKLAILFHCTGIQLSYSNNQPHSKFMLVNVYGRDYKYLKITDLSLLLLPFF